jgi:predicted Zn-dependent protease
MRRLGLAFLLLAASTAVAQAPQSKTDAEIKAEYEQAQKFYMASNFVAALPLFEDLYTQQPKSLIYEERLAMSLLGAADNMTPENGKAAHARAKRLLLDAQKNGDNSPLLMTLLEKMGDGDGSSAAPDAPLTPAKADFAEAEKLFGKGDMKAALTLYQKALAEDPTFYLAALYAGDVLFKSGDCPGAGEYYAKAVALDPDHETAFRYWADCLVKQKDMSRAEQMYIKAIIAQPYQRTTRQSLGAWADLNHSRIVPPPITLPKRAEPDSKGNTNINVDMATLMSPAGAAWLVYLMAPTVWQKSEFAKHYPNEKTYRHSLAEEAESLRSVLSVAKEKKGDLAKDTTLKTLAELEKDGMLECWILLDAPDQGIAQDYVAYRKEHRELMAKYIAKYDVHPL